MSASASTSALRSLTNDALIDRLKALVRRERRDTIAVLHHLAEVERRRLHLTLGYRSLFAYCTGALGYSESAAGRRIQAARCMRRYPRLERLLERREVSLSSVSQVAGIALSQNQPGLFERIRGRTRDEVASIVAALRPQAPPRDRVSVVCVRPKGRSVRTSDAQPLLGAAPGPATAKDMTPAPLSASDHSRGGSASASTAPAPASESADPAPAGETRYVVRFCAGGGLMRALEEVRALLSFRLPAGAPMEDLLAALCEEFIDRHSPARRRARRRKRAQSRQQRTQGTEHVTRRSGGPDARRIPAPVRDEVMAKGGGRCSYVGPDGRRCNATRHLQVDHIRPVALGGDAEPENLRVLCAAHNRLEAQRLLGRAVMDRYARRE